MRKLLFIIGIMALVGCQAEDPEGDVAKDCATEIAEYNAEKANAESGLIEGDIIPNSNIKGNLIKDQDRAWTKVNGKVVVPFHISDEYSLPEYREDVKQMFKKLEIQTNIKFQEFDSKEQMEGKFGHGLVIKPSFFGSSSVGRNPNGTQDIYFVFDLESNRTNIHEVGHALGLEHEHNRHDRNDNIIVLFDNIPEKTHDEWQAKDRSFDCGEYDLESIMHYDSGDSEKPKLTTLDGSLVPVNDKFSKGDLEAIRIFNGIN